MGIVQARTGSTRLPGKVLKPVCGRTLLEHQMERMLRARSLDRLVVATTTSPADDAIVDLVRARGWICHCGSETDVLSRYAEAARAEGAAVVVRMTMDCPLIDPEVVDLVVGMLRGGPFDFVTNNLEPTFPHGLDLEAFTRPTLDAADRDAVAAFDREHVSPFVRDRPDRFRIGNVRSPSDLHHHRWTVDYPEDLAFVRAVYEALYRPGGFFSTADVLALLAERPELMRINEGQGTA